MLMEAVSEVGQARRESELQKLKTKLTNYEIAMLM
jgi:hypothetical protein